MYNFLHLLFPYDRTNDYLSRRIVESEHETVRQQWNKASLEKSVSEIHERQQDKEKHT